MNQKGIAQILILLLLVAGIGFGAYVVQQRTNILPHAENNAPRTDNGDCRDNPTDPPSTPDGENFSYKWKADCNKFCDKNSDCPQNSGDSDRVEKNTSAWCYGFGDGTNRCMMLVSVDKSSKKENSSNSNNSSSNSSNNSGSSGDPRDSTRTDKSNCRNNPVDPPSTPNSENFKYLWKADCTSSCGKNSECKQNTKDPDRVEKNTSNWCFGFGDGSNSCMMLVSVDKSSGKENESSFSPMNNKTSSGTNGSGSAAACTTNQVQQVANTYYDAKVAQRYARYTAIIRGAKEYCVQADLGIEAPGIPPLRENSADGGVQNGRLYLCSGKNNAADKLDLVWRVISDDGKDIRESTRSNPGSEADVNTVMSGYIAVAKQKLGL